MAWLWEKGYRTRYSCENSAGRMNVSFWNAAHFESAYLDLVELAATSQDPCLRHRAVGVDVAPDEKSSSGRHSHDPAANWAFEVWPFVHLLENDRRVGAEADEPGSLNYRISMPADDLEALTQLPRPAS